MPSGIGDGGSSLRENDADVAPPKKLPKGIVLDKDGKQRNPGLLDYKLVTCSDAPPIDIEWVGRFTPDAGPRGSKGVGEPPSVPTAGAIANAIARVIGAPVCQLPMTPERVWETIQEAAK